MSMKPTQEQQDYLDISRANINIALDAKAGCGKTATACLVGQHNPDKKIRIVWRS
jgi:hypothetical protein